MDGRREGGEVGGEFSLLVEWVKYANIAWPSCHLTNILLGQGKLCMRQSSYPCSHWLGVLDHNTEQKMCQ